MRLLTNELALRVGVSAQTIYRWLRAGKVPEPPRDRNGWRIWEKEQIEAVEAYANRRLPPTPQESVFGRPRRGRPP